MSIAENIQRILAEKNITQTELAKRLGLTSQAVSQWVSGASTPRGSRVRAIADALGVSPNRVLPIDDPSVEAQAVQKLREYLSASARGDLSSLTMNSYVSQKEVNQALSGEMHGSQLRHLLNNICAAQRLNSDYFFYGEDTPRDPLEAIKLSMSDRPDLTVAKPPKIATPGVNPRTMPVWRTIEGGEDGSMCVTIGTPDLAVDWIVRPKVVENVREAFALYVVGSSMEPRWMPGELLIINPFRPVRQGDPVLIILHSDDDRDVKRALFKRLVRRSPSSLVVAQTNPAMEFDIAADGIEHVWRIYEWGELLSGL